MSDYLPGDYLGARRVVNGTDRAAQIARHARDFEAALRAGATSPTAPASSPGWFAAISSAAGSIIAAILRIFTKG